MILFIWAVIAIVIIASAILIYIEHEWGLVLGGSTAVILVISYFSVDVILRTPLAALLPQSARSPFDAMAIVAGTILVLVLMIIAYLAGRRSASGKTSQKP